jgi:hypothetical protein
MRYPARLIRNLTILALVITMLNKVFLCYYRVNYNQNISTLIITEEHRYACLFAETAIANYRLSFANQGKQTSVFRFCLQQRHESLPFPFSVCSKQTEVAIFCPLKIYHHNTMALFCAKCVPCSIMPRQLTILQGKTKTIKKVKTNEILRNSEV